MVLLSRTVLNQVSLEQVYWWILIELLRLVRIKKKNIYQPKMRLLIKRAKGRFLGDTCHKIIGQMSSFVSFHRLLFSYQCCCVNIQVVASCSTGGLTGFVQVRNGFDSCSFLKKIILSVCFDKNDIVLKCFRRQRSFLC